MTTPVWRKVMPVAVFTALAVPAAAIAIPALADDTDPGDDLGTNIVGGGTVEDEVPWIVALHKDGDDFQCTSTQISPEWVLTAAHCVDEDKPYSARIGSLTRSSGGTMIDVEKVEIHPEYVEGNLYDIALLKLAEPFENEFPALATEADLEIGQAATIYGWGSEKEDWSGPLPENLKFADGFNTDKPCSTPNDICFKGEGDNAGGVAGGDSGGPMLVESIASGELVLTGACEAGYNPSNQNWGGYASVVHNAEWLNELTGL